MVATVHAPALHSIPATALRLGVSPDTVRRMIAAGEIRHVRLRKLLMVSERAIQDWLTANESTTYRPR
jgi:excisionase family DNA binding protein